MLKPYTLRLLTATATAVCVCEPHTVLCGALYTACVDASRMVFWDSSHEIHTKQILLSEKMTQSDPEFQIKCQIIAEVQQRPLLYKKGYPQYQITSCRNEEFAHIGISVGKTGQ